MKGWSSPAVDDASPSTVVESNVSAQLSNLSLASTHTGESGSGSTNSPPTSMSTTACNGSLRVAYLTEQISHHPPISAYVAACPARYITLSGIDQISVRVLPSASVRVSSGAMNKGLFVSLNGGPGAGERYQITHPVAHVNGVLRGSFYATVHESTIVTCAGGPGVGDGEMLRAIIEYKEEVRLFFVPPRDFYRRSRFRAGLASRISWSRELYTGTIHPRTSTKNGPKSSTSRPLVSKHISRDAGKALCAGVPLSRQHPQGQGHRRRRRRRHCHQHRPVLLQPPLAPRRAR